MSTWIIIPVLLIGAFFVALLLFRCGNQRSGTLKVNNTKIKGLNMSETKDSGVFRPVSV